MKQKHRIKRLFTHGKNSKPKWICKDCGEIIPRGEYKKQMQKREKQ